MPNKRQIAPKGSIPGWFIIEKTLSGICKAQKDYKDWSGGWWVWQTHEYVLTVYIVKEIMKGVAKSGRPGSMYLKIEEKVQEVITAAGGAGSGRISQKARVSGRVDITLLKADGESPRALIEVKRQVESCSNIRDGTSRICLALRNEENSLEFCLMAFYTSRRRKRTDSNGARVAIEERFEEITDGVRSFLGKKYDLGSCYRVVGNDDDAWAACVLQIRGAPATVR